MSTRTDDELTELVREARRPGKVAHLKADLPALDAESVEPFATLVARCEAEAEAFWAKGGWQVERKRAASRTLLEEGADDAVVEALARRRETTTRINAAMLTRLHECTNAPLTGEGLATLTGGGPVVLAFEHSVPTGAAWWSAMRAAGRPSFWPADPVQTVDEAPELAAIHAYVEELGGLFVGRRGRFEVYRELLREGEICALNVNIPGREEVRMFGRTRWITSAHARLAAETGAPVVVVAAFLDGTRFEARLSAPIYADAHASPQQVQQRMVSAVEELLEGDPARLMAPPPSAPPEELEAQRLAFGELKRASGEAAARFAAAQAELKRARAELAAAREGRDEALARWREAQVRRMTGGTL